MADNRLNKTGLQYFYDRIKTIFATKTEVTNLSDRVDDIVAEGGEPNVIEAIKVNGTEQTVTNKTVDITTPTVIQNQVGGYTEVDVYQDAVRSQNHLNVKYKEADEYVSVFVGGLQQDGDGVQLAPMSSIPTAVSSLTNDSGYQTASDVTSAIDTAIGGITGIDYQVVTKLPTKGEKGVIYLISNSGTAPNVYDEYIYTNNAFEKIGTTDVDLTGYFNETNLTAITTAEIDTIIDG